MLIIDNYPNFYVIFMCNSLIIVMKDAKRITNFSMKTTLQPLIQNSPHSPANLQNRYLFDHAPLS